MMVTKYINRSCKNVGKEDKSTSRVNPILPNVSQLFTKCRGRSHFKLRCHQSEFGSEQNKKRSCLFVWCSYMNDWHSAASSYSQLQPTSKAADLRNVSSAENWCLSYFSSLLHVELSSHVLGRLIFERNEDADAPSDWESNCHPRWG